MLLIPKLAAMSEVYDSSPNRTEVFYMFATDKLTYNSQMKINIGPKQQSYENIHQERKGKMKINIQRKRIKDMKECAQTSPFKNPCIT